MQGRLASKLAGDGSEHHSAIFPGTQRHSLGRLATRIKHNPDRQGQLNIHPNGGLLLPGGANATGALLGILALQIDFKPAGAGDFKVMIGIQRRWWSASCQPSLPASFGLQHYAVGAGRKLDLEQMVNGQFEIEGYLIIAGLHDIAKVEILTRPYAIGNAAGVSAHFHGQGVGRMHFIADVHIAIPERCRDRHLGHFHAGRGRSLRRLPEIVVEGCVTAAHTAIGTRAGCIHPGRFPQVTVPGAAAEDIAPAQTRDPPLHL